MNSNRFKQSHLQLLGKDKAKILLGRLAVHLEVAAAEYTMGDWIRAVESILDCLPAIDVLVDDWASTVIGTCVKVMIAEVPCAYEGFICGNGAIKVPAFEEFVGQLQVLIALVRIVLLEMGDEQMADWEGEELVSINEVEQVMLAVEKLKDRIEGLRNVKREEVYRADDLGEGVCSDDQYSLLESQLEYLENVHGLLDDAEDQLRSYE